MKSIIIYFSRSGENYFNGAIRYIDVGNTHVVADILQQLTGADMFKIEPVKPYPDNYNECTDVAKREQDENMRPPVKSYPQNLDKYDIVYIGYPNWWGTMPMPVMSVLEKCNMAGKIIKPFCTHEGSGMGHSVSDIRRLCPDADVRDGLAIYGSDSHDAKSALSEWIKK